MDFEESQINYSLMLRVFGILMLTGISILGYGIGGQGWFDLAASSAAAKNVQDLKVETLNRSTRLTAQQRDKAIERCTGSFATQRRSCDCLVNQFEDRTTHLQFAMAMARFDRSWWNILGSGGSDYSHLFPIAQKAGLSQSGFESAARETAQIIQSATRYCYNQR